MRAAFVKGNAFVILALLSLLAIIRPATSQNPNPCPGLIPQLFEINHPEVCQQRGRACAQGQRCNFKVRPPMCEVDNAAVQEILEIGKPCTSSADCPYTRRCRSCGQCSTHAGFHGDACGDDADCWNGFCPLDDAGNGVCTARPGSFGTACLSNADCKPVNGIDITCGYSDDGSTTVCTLVQKGDPGYPCTEGSQCKSGSCNGMIGNQKVCGTFAQRDCKPKGLACTGNSECCSGSCASTELIFLYQCT